MNIPKNSFLHEHKDETYSSPPGSTDQRNIASPNINGQKFIWFLKNNVEFM